jgi:hypothetical protein
MTELFHLIAGTSTGSIMTSALSTPNEDGVTNKYWAQDVIDVYINNGTTVFSTYSVTTPSLIMGMILFCIFGGLLGFFVTRCMY